MKCLKFKSLPRGAMLGFADLQMENGIVLLGCTLMESNGKRWCSPPGRPQLDPARNLMRDENGKIIYAPVIDFADKSMRWKWSDAAVAAVGAFIESGGADSTTPAFAGAGNGRGTRTAKPWGLNES